jgi:putative oxidoreductase
MPSRQRVLSVVGWGALWLFTLLLVMIFFKAGRDKFDDHSGWARAFTHWGFPVWFRMLVGVMELSAAALLLWPRTAPLGAALIIVVMLGGMGTHLARDHGRHMTSELMPLVVASVILYVRRGELRRPWRRREGRLAAA